MSGHWSAKRNPNGTSSQLRYAWLSASAWPIVQWKPHRYLGLQFSQAQCLFAPRIALQSCVSVCKHWFCKLCHLAFVCFMIHQFIGRDTMNNCKTIEKPAGASQSPAPKSMVCIIFNGIESLSWTECINVPANPRTRFTVFSQRLFPYSWSQWPWKLSKPHNMPQ